MLISSIEQRASKKNATVVFPDATDGRTIQAAEILQSRKIATPMLVTNDTNVDTEALASFLLAKRSGKGLSLEQALTMAHDPLYKAAWLVESGVATAGVAGSQSTTADVLRAGIYTIGAVANSTISSFFLMIGEHDTALTYADCAVVPDPSAEQLAEIAWQSAQSHYMLTQVQPRVAFLSFSTKGSASHPHAGKVRKAFEIFTAAHPEIIADGELQVDAAIVPQVAHRKAPHSALAGMANVLIFPTLDAGNIAYKVTERLARYTAVGPIVQGLRKPFVDLSRGCSVQDIVLAACIAILQSNQPDADTANQH